MTRSNLRIDIEWKRNREDKDGCNGSKKRLQTTNTSQEETQEAASHLRPIADFPSRCHRPNQTERLPSCERKGLKQLMVARERNDIKRNTTKRFGLVPCLLIILNSVLSLAKYLRRGVFTVVVTLPDEKSPLFLSKHFFLCTIICTHVHYSNIIVQIY